MIAGEEVGFYFGWMCFYLKFICVPLVIGLAMYILRSGGVTVNTDPYLPFFSVVMALWGVLFIVVRLFTEFNFGVAVSLLTNFCKTLPANLLFPEREHVAGKTFTNSSEPFIKVYNITSSLGPLQILHIVQHTL